MSEATGGTHGLGDALRTPVTDVDGARRWMDALESAHYAAHPDDRGSGMVDPSGAATFAPDEAAAYDARWDETFSVMDAAGLDVYGESMDALRRGPRGAFFGRD